ncbi:photosystem I reaction center subunit V, chloroplastic-like [Magnolia sinica]|uniref:photosystem I reaction center subunit V, chloroplastic-like n=1 Tax=Magnolia sinica TaxID=86752 RepID=UPI00265941B8|nr:photosystem I reaction center subunit V, chloroplastic-like [Magnolia sinica]
MASTLFTTPTFTPTIPKHSQSTTTPHQSFHGLRPIRPTDAFYSKFTVHRSSSTTSRRSIAKIGSPRAELNASLVISLSTAVSLFLGRFVFLNFQRENVAKQVPGQNGVTHFEAGDTRAKEYVGLLKSNDPAGFNIVDVLAWGSIGHIVAYYILATSSNGYDPKFFE